MSSPNQSTCWGPLRSRRTMTNRDRVAGRSTLSLPDVPHLLPDAPLADPAGKLGAPAVLLDTLDPAEFPDWAAHRRIQLSFDGAGGLVVSDRAEVSRCALASSDGSTYGRAPDRTLLAQLERTFQIPY